MLIGKKGNQKGKIPEEAKGTEPTIIKSSHETKKDGRKAVDERGVYSSESLLFT